MNSQSKPQKRRRFQRKSKRRREGASPPEWLRPLPKGNPENKKKKNQTHSIPPNCRRRGGSSWSPPPDESGARSDGWDRCSPFASRLRRRRWASLTSEQSHVPGQEIAALWLAAGRRRRLRCSCPPTLKGGFSFSCKSNQNFNFQGGSFYLFLQNCLLLFKLSIKNILLIWEARKVMIQIGYNNGQSKFDWLWHCLIW